MKIKILILLVLAFICYNNNFAQDTKKKKVITTITSYKDGKLVTTTTEDDVESTSRKMNKVKVGNVEVNIFDDEVTKKRSYTNRSDNHIDEPSTTNSRNKKSRDDGNGAAINGVSPNNYNKKNEINEDDEFNDIENEITKLKDRSKEAVSKVMDKISTSINQIKTPGTRNNSYSLNFDDKITNTKDFKTRPIKKEISVTGLNSLQLNNENRTIEITEGKENVIIIKTEIYYTGEKDKLTDDEWFEKLNINTKNFGKALKIKSGNINDGYANNENSYSSGNVALFNEFGENIGNVNSIKKRLVIIEIPKNLKLEIDSKYGNITIKNKIKEAVIDLKNNNIEILDIDQLSLTAKYSNVSIAKINTGDLDVMNGNLELQDVGDIDLYTKYSNVDIGKSNNINFTSNNDEYEIETVNELVGNKNYGNLRIKKLEGNIDIKGSNGDLKIQSIGNKVSNIKINNKYANIKFGIKGIENYMIDYEGSYSTVRGPFEKKPVAVKSTTTQSTNSWPATSSCNCPDDTPRNFTAKVGSSTKALKFEIVCANCDVDFR